MVRRMLIGSVILTALLVATLPAAGKSEAAFPAAPAADAWRVAARDGTPLQIQAGARTFEVVVHENEALWRDAGPILEADGTPYAGEPILTLTGEVVGEPGSWVRVTVTGDTVLGMLHSPSAGGITIAPMRDGSARVVRDGTLAGLLQRAGIDTTIEPAGVEAAVDCDSLFWEPKVASPVFLALGAPQRTFDVAWAVDTSFTTRYGANWAGVAVGLVNAIDGLYDAQFDVRLSIVHLVAIADADLPGTTTSALLDQLQDHYVVHFPTLQRDNVNLWTPRDTTNAAGQVNCVGSAGRTSVSYSVSTTEGGPYTFIPGLVLLPNKAIKVTAHELAHTVSAHHHYANCVESLAVINPFETLDLCTVMINDWGLIQETFSSAERLTVRGWVDHYDL